MRRRSSSRRLRSKAFLLSCSLALGGIAFAQGPEPANLSVAESIGREVQALFQKCQTAIVRIEASDSHGKLSGTGFFIDPNGTIYTSYSVGGESHAIVVHHGAQKYPGQVRGL
jgi:S1-C subfamily serine protease